MPDYAEAETDTALADPHANFEREYILSNGGDIGSPGFSIYREGNILFPEWITDINPHKVYIFMYVFWFTQ